MHPHGGSQINVQQVWLKCVKKEKYELQYTHMAALTNLRRYEAKKCRKLVSGDTTRSENLRALLRS